MNIRRSFKCQGLRRIAADCPNKRVITLTEWKVVKEYKVDEEKEENLEEEEN